MKSGIALLTGDELTSALKMFAASSMGLLLGAMPTPLQAQTVREPVASITEPMVVETFEVETLRVVPVVTGLANPFAMAFRSNGDILITERYAGRLRIIRDGRLLPQPIPGLPEIYGGEFRAGLMGIALHPQDDSRVYLSYHKLIVTNGEPDQTVALARGRLVEDRLVDVSEIFVASEPDTAISASVLLFTPDNKLLMSVGGAVAYAGIGELAQDPASHYGKLLRLNDDGTVPADNPFVTSGEFLPEVYSVGHRNQLGLTLHPQTGAIWSTENGPQGGDEVNIVLPGKNYGWPVASYSRMYRGDWVSETPWREEFESPVVLWWPSIAPSALTFYRGDKIPAWQDNLLVGSLMVGRIPGTGHLERIVFNSRGQEIRREALLRELKQRVIDVKQDPDGNLYVLTDEEDGALLRLEQETRQ
ncbi:MAG: PQQ-dependent sugar dehydrogenase [Pseudohongiellaceae bacterium]